MPLVLGFLLILHFCGYVVSNVCPVNICVCPTVVFGSYHVHDGSQGKYLVSLTEQQGHWPVAGFSCGDP